MPRSTRWYLGAVLALIPLELALAWNVSRRAVTAADDVLLRGITALRTSGIYSIAEWMQWLGSPNAARVVAWVTIAVLLFTRRFRHLVVYLALLLTVALSAGYLGLLQGRMRPTSVTVLGEWSGYAHPSVPIAALAAAATGLCYTCVPRGRWRTGALTVAATAIGLLAASRLLLAVDHPSDTLAALAIGWAMPIAAYRLLTPDDAFPVTYHRGTHAHLDVGGARGAAIVTALASQLGIQAESVEPFGSAGSAGSTPVRIRGRDTAGLPAQYFGKICAINHLRADRSYKTTRMVLYGRLEDEKPFSTVRRLVEYEDHMLRLLRDAGVPVPAPVGFVEITPEREYMVVMGFVDGAHEIGQEPVGEQEIDEALAIVRKLWEAGVAHRDIKPSNVLTRDGKVFLIDVAFAAARPTPWRQAVDLANMMLTLALSSSAEVVYARALRLFAAQDVAEAFAASRSVTLPTQLKARLRASDRDLVGEFRRLAPTRAPVAIQLWTLRRLVAAAMVLLGMALAATGLYAYARLAGLT